MESSSSAIVELHPVADFSLEGDHVRRSDFTSYVYPRKSLLVFYSPGCGWCRNFMPVLENAARYLGPRGFPVARFDGSRQDEATRRIMWRWGIEGFPSAFLLINGHPVAKFPTQLDRSQENVVEFVLQYRQP